MNPNPGNRFPKRRIRQPVHMWFSGGYTRARGYPPQSQSVGLFTRSISKCVANCVASRAGQRAS